MTTMYMQQQQQAGGFAFQAPGNAEPDEGLGPYAVDTKPLKAVGLVPMQIDSRHNIPVNRGGKVKPESVTCKDRRNYRNFSVRIFCLHPGCVGRSWATVEEMAKAHPDHALMQREQQVHLFGAWSDDPCNPPEPSCGECAAATIAASEKATAAARDKDKKAGEVKVAMPCVKHAGGVVGLLTPGDPNAA